MLLSASISTPLTLPDSIDETKLSTLSCHSRYADIKDIPLVFVAKKPSKTKVRLYEWITITITLTNLGNGTAYNLTVIDEDYPEWTIETRNHSTRYLVPLLQPNVTIQIRYWVRITSTTYKNISLGRVIVIYRDIKNNQYKSISEETIVSIELRVIEVNIEYVDKAILTSTVAISVTSLLCLIFIERKTLKEFLATKKRG